MGAICTKQTTGFSATGTNHSLEIYLDDLSQPLDTPHPTVEDPTMLLVIKEFIRSDGYAEVFQGNFQGQKILVHRLTKTALEPIQRRDFESEVKKYNQLKHPNIATILGARVQPEKFCFTTQAFEKGMLNNLLKDDRTNISEASKIKVMHNIAQGLHYLHTQAPAIRHEDLRTTSIGIMSDWSAIVLGYGFSSLKALCRMQSLNQESAAATDPGLFLGHQLSLKSDVYSFGIVMWEVWTRKIPFEGVNPLKIVHDTSRGDRPPIPGDMKEPYKKLMTDCWETLPDNRPGFGDVVTRFGSIAH